MKKVLDEEIDTLFKLTHHQVFRIQIQVFKLLMQFAKVTKDGEENNINDRFYRTLYELLLKVHTSRATSLDDYFGLVFRAIKNDQDQGRCLAFIKRLLQMTYFNESHFTAASLLVISEVLKLRSDLKMTIFGFEGVT